VLLAANKFSFPLNYSNNYISLQFVLRIFSMDACNY